MSIRRDDFIFTKGPWILGPWVKNKAEVNAGGWDCLACVYRGAEDDHQRTSGEANAKLIAAAPEMLYAIDEALRVLGKNTSNMSPEEFSAFEELKRVFNVARMGRDWDK